MNIVSKVSIKIGDYEFKPPKTAKRMVMERGDDQSQTKLRHLRAAGPVMTKFKKKNRTLDSIQCAGGEISAKKKKMSRSLDNRQETTKSQNIPEIENLEPAQ